MVTEINASHIETLEQAINLLSTSGPHVSITKLTNTELFQIIAKALEYNTVIKILELRYQDIKEDGAIALAEALKVNEVIHTLNLHDNDIGEAGAIAIAEALKENKAIHTLKLCDNDIRDDGAIALADMLKVNTVLHTLDLSDNCMGEAGATALAEALKVNTVLHTINLDKNFIGDAGITKIAEALKFNTVITNLNLERNDIGGVGAEAIAKALKVNVAITHLYLGCNNIGNAGAKAIAEALKVNPVIIKLILIDNKIGDAGATALADMLKVNPVIHTLNLYDNHIGVAEATAIAEALQKNRGFLKVPIAKLLNREELTTGELKALITHLGDTDSPYSKKQLCDALTKELAKLPPDSFNPLYPNKDALYDLVPKIELPTKEPIDAPLLTTEQSIHAGIATGRVIASPFIHYLNDQVNYQNQDKSLIDYYAEPFTLTNTIKSAVFSATFYALPNYLSIANKVLIAKMVSDIPVNEFQISAEYATSALLQLKNSFVSFAIVSVATKSAVYQDHPFATGILVSTAGDLMKLSYDAAHVCYDLIMGKDNSTAIEGEL